MNNQEYRKLKKLIQNYNNASIDLSWIGSKDPEDHKEIKERFNEAKKKLTEYIESLHKIEF